MGPQAAAAGVRFDAELLARYDVNGPRYTSYPTAPHFRPEFGESQYRDHARASNDEPIPRPLSLYVHVPFCASPCFYCGCTRVITRDRSMAALYLSRLVREIAQQGALFDRDRPVTQLHFGGGTPNFLATSQLAELMAALAGEFQLHGGPDREFSIEIDPRYADAALLDALGRLGFNRASLGVQDFDPEVQRAVNRIQPVKHTTEVVAAARAAGMGSVNLDLIYGLPRQTPDGFARTLETVIALRPERIALYGYAHLPQRFKGQRRIDARELPAPAQKLALLGLAIQAFGAAGYRYIGMDHFALPADPLVQAQAAGTLRRNFQGYSTHAECDLIGLGMSAIGRVGDCYAQNARDLAGYYAALDAGRLPIVRGVVLDDEDVLRSELIQSVMCHDGIDIPTIERRFGIRFSERFARELECLRALAADGLATVDDDAIRVTPSGRLLLRNIAMCFDAYLARPGAAPAGYSRVI